MSRNLNINIGVLGHVDSGKTSLTRALSTHLSTCSMDKSPQSQERGITLDLGFSAFYVPAPAHLADSYDQVQFTLVDCPGHASLIRTIIGGAHIIDEMILVIDATKGIQTQTAECIVIGEILIDRLLIVINKMDLLKKPDEDLQKLVKGLRATFKKTKFGADVSIVCVSAHIPEKLVEVTAANVETASTHSPQCNVGDLVRHLTSTVRVPERGRPGQNFYFSVDHCFGIKGQGTVLTGTVLNGQVSVGDNIELPGLGLVKKVKSMQMFHQPVETAVSGDRVGICVTQLDPKAMERGLACAPGSVGNFAAAIARVDKIRFFKGIVANKSSFHVTVGHSTVMAEVHFFGLSSSVNDAPPADGRSVESAAAGAIPSSPSSTNQRLSAFDFNRDYHYRDELLPVSESNPIGSQFALLVFEGRVTAPLDSIVIGSRLDQDIHLNTCRLTFSGHLITGIDFETPDERERLRIFKYKTREGAIDRIVDSHSLVGKDLFAKGADITQFVGMKVFLSTGQRGFIESSFGKSGKFRVQLTEALDIAEKAGRGGEGNSGKIKILLRMKKFVFSKEKKSFEQD